MIMYQNTYKPPFTPSTSFASTSTFGQPAPNQNIFPSMQPTNIFQSQPSSSFTAGPSTQTQFGSNLFGQPAQPASNGLFGNSNAFGQTKSFGFGTTAAQPSLFGQPQPQPQASTNLFQPNTSNLFGSTNAFASTPAQSGTVVKFSPVSGTDTMQKNGVAQTISTKHHCITCMKEYETKSLEELRFEDYSVSRKGPQQSSFTQAPFGAAVANTVGTPAGNLFGQPENKQAFGQTTGFGQATGFGQNTSGFGLNANQNSTTNLFGQKQTAFGTPTTNANTFGAFNTTTSVANPFSANQPQKTFSQTNFFGTPAVQPSQTGFGNTSVFGQTATQSTPVFPSSNQTGGFSFNQPTATQSTPNLFQVSKANTGFGIFGQTNTATTGFGQTATPAFGTTFGQKSSTTSFGQPIQTGFGTTLGGGLQTQQQQQQTSLFNTNAKAPPLFSNTGSQAGLFMGNTYQPATNNMFSMPNFSQQAPASFAPEESESKNIQFVATDISPDGRQYRGLDPVLPNSLANATATNPAELQAILESAKKRDDVENARFKAKIPPPKLHKVAGVEGGTLPPRLYFSQRPNLHREFFDSTKAVSVSPRCLVLKKVSSTASPVLGKYRNELLEEAEMAMRPDKSSLTDIRTAGNDAYNSFQEEEPPLMAMKLNFDTSSLGSATDLLEERRPTVRTKSKHRSIPVELEFDTDGNSICEDPVEFQPLRSSSLFALKGYVPEIEETTDTDTPSVVSIEEHPYGVVLTRPEYYMFPDKKDLHQYADENGRVIVPGLTIGRKGYGNVYFSDHIDITNMNLDEMIHFRHREITVYPDDSVKPPVGEGLNRPAQVTLDKIYPREKNSQVYVTDIDEIAKTNFVDKLMAITQKHKCKFIDYRPKTGSWVFKVSHFSKYGFTDSDEDECTIQKNEATETAKKLDQLAKKPEEAQSLQIGLGGGDASIQVSSPEMTKTSPADIEMHVVEQDVYWEDHSFSFRTARVQDKGAIKTSLFGEAEAPVIFKPSALTTKAVGVSASLPERRDTTEMDVDVSLLEPSVVRVEPAVYELPRLIPQCLPGRTHMWQVKTYTELALFRSDAFKPGWTKGCQFFHFVPSCDMTNVCYTVNNCTVTVTGPSSYDSMMPNLDDALKIAVESSTLEVDDFGVPTLVIKKDPSFLKEQTLLFHSQIRSRCLPGKQRYLAHLWNLCSALWLGNDLTEYDRKANFSKWLKVATNDLSNKVSNKCQLSPVEQVFDHLTFHRVYDACDVAMRNKMPRTSLLISQNIDTGKDLLVGYLDSSEWRHNIVPDEIKKIYMLLAGIPVKEGVNICNGIDWKRSMGLCLWYIASYDSSIYEVAQLFREAFEAGFSAPPFPQHTRDEYDLYWHVILLYCNNHHLLRKVLNPATHTPNQTDYRLSWLLLQLFKSLQVGSIDENEEQYLHTTFSNQLEEIGLWKWSIVTLMYLKNNILKKNMIIKVLERNLSHETNEIETELVLNYKLPAEWIHEVKAYQSEYFNKHYDSFQHFVHMGNHFDACNIFSNTLMPELFINERYSELKRFLIILEPYSRSLLNWNVHAGLVYDYLKLHEVFSQEDESRYKLLQFDFDKVIDRLIYFPMKNATQNVMLTELCRRCALMFKIIFKDLTPQRFLAKFNDMFRNLVMPPDCKQFELEYMAYLQFGCSTA